MSRLRDEHNDRTLVERIDPLMGSVLDKRYRIDFRLAAGGFGAIYRATHVETGKQYALKVLLGDLATSDARVIARFRQEGATLAQLKNPHTIQAYELGEAPDGSLYIAMELLHGESLFEQFRSKGPLPWQRVAAIGRMVCSSLGEAHALGVIHRDLKPANIHLETRDGNPDFVKVLDFGIAKIVRDSEHLDAMELTQAGQMIGTTDYMAPEQMVGGQATGCTDIYTLGVVLYEMITGRRPFSDASNPTAMLAALLTQTPPPLVTPGVPRELQRILMKCLEREPQNRYQTVEALAADLESLLAPQHATRAPVHVVDEPTVIEHRRAKRASTPHVVRREEAVIEGRPRRQSEPPPAHGSHESPPRPKHDTSPPNVIRRDAIRRGGTGPIADEPTIRRDAAALAAEPATLRREGTGPIDRPKRDSSPPPVVQQDPNAWQSLQIPRRDRDSQPVPVVQSQQPESQRIQRYQAGAFNVSADPAYQPTPTPAPHVFAPSPTPTPAPHVFAPSPTPTPFPIPVPPPNTWQAPYPQPPARDASQGYDMAGVHSRDVVVRRVVWSIALVLGLILTVIVASRL